MLDHKASATRLCFPVAAGAGASTWCWPNGKWTRTSGCTRSTGWRRPPTSCGNNPPQSPCSFQKAALFQSAPQEPLPPAIYSTFTFHIYLLFFGFRLVSLLTYLNNFLNTFDTFFFSLSTFIFLERKSSPKFFFFANIYK